MIGNSILNDKQKLRENKKKIKKRGLTNFECKKKKRLSKKIYGNGNGITRATHAVLVYILKRARV